MRVLLVDPKGNVMGINIGLAYLSAALRDKGHKVAVLDLSNFRTALPEDSL